ncbi:MAG: aspartate aminotransferase family protein, partial [Bacteroidia bacterium]|nr:aspartate aminotransferase family protein [Bacteroidia bacterium]
LKPDFYKELEAKVVFLLDQIKQNLKSGSLHLQLFSIGSIFWIAFTDKQKIQAAEQIDPDSMKHFKLLHRELLELGVYLGPSGYEVGFVSEAHSEVDLMKTAYAFIEALNKITRIYQ